MSDYNTLSAGLKPLLSSEARIVGSEDTITRWDVSCAPTPIMTVAPRCEKDVAETVKYCRAKGLKCFAQSGGHGWRVRNHKDIDVVICLREMNQVTVNEDSKTVTLGGGTIVGELIAAATEKKLEVATGVCNSVGALGSMLHGGIGRYMGKYGLGIDNLLSVNFVDATGTLHENVNEETDSDLWWAIRGAGTSFGIVTQATIQGHPQSNELTWSGALIFGDPSKIESIVETIDTMDMDENMCVHFLFMCPPPTFAPVIMVAPWYNGPEEVAEKMWKPILDLGPTIKETFMAPADKLNDGNDPFGEKGGRKPGVGLGLQKLDPGAYREVWSQYVNFITENPGAGRSVILAEYYPKKKTLSVERETTVFANRDIKYEVICAPWYDDEKLDIRANLFTQTIREIWAQKCANPQKLQSYAAFAGLNEPLSSIFGEEERINKFLSLKKKWDPENYWGAMLGDE
ncbi:hypothetical protein ABW20_dc0107990 [Dactylellina cionopaga]|nr:hypothetical protein ABW20_dc0107990 [Dactylellina cionopaga]